jgi:hypothetical protein
MIYSELFIFAANFAKRRIRCSMPECGGSKAESRTAAKAILVLLLDHMTAERIRALAREWELKAPHVVAEGRKPKHFTPDGRMVGDIGEVLAERLFCIRLEKNQRAGYDGILEKDGKTRVEIKITRKKAFQFRKITDQVIALSFVEGSKEVEVVFNGLGSLLINKAPGMKDRAKWMGDHWHFDKPFNIDPARLRDLITANHKHRVPLRDGITQVSRP